MILGALLKRIEKLAIPLNPIMKDVMNDPILQAQIIDANQSQLYDKGLQADGTTTGEYAPITVSYYKPKAAANGMGVLPGRQLVTSHITGYDTGETFESMRVSVNDGGIKITAEDRNNFFDREPKGLGLTTESKNELFPEIKESFVSKYKKKAGF